ncbi:MAG: cysteine hydrolase [Acidobacteria bacterium]|nr:cysteine hydrolase [Acidobacteriota bacterium]
MIIDTEQFHVKRLPSDVVLPAEKTALVIIDMINRFCDPEWLGHGEPKRVAWFREKLDTAVPKCQQLLDAFRTADALVAHVVIARWTKDGREVPPYVRGRDYDFFNTAPMQVIEQLKPRQGEILVHKVGSSAFVGTGLEFMLKNAGIENVVLAGTYGNACCFYSLIQSRDMGFNNIWAEDAILYADQVRTDLFPFLIGAYWARLAKVNEIAAALSQ